METIVFTPEKARSLLRAYEAAVKRGDSQFTWQGHELLVSYARYLLEYLESRGLLEGKTA